MSRQKLLTPAHSVVRGRQIVQADVDGEIVALHIEKGFCYGLNKVSSRIWELAETPKRISEICATLQDEYDVPGATCESDVLALLEQLCAEGLMDILQSAAPAPSS